MSYILEALKKSQQERELGTIPDPMFAPLPGPTGRKSRSLWLLSIPVLLLVSAIALSLIFSLPSVENQPVSLSRLAPKAEDQPAAGVGVPDRAPSAHAQKVSPVVHPSFDNTKTVAAAATGAADDEQAVRYQPETESSKPFPRIPGPAKPVSAGLPSSDNAKSVSAAATEAADDQIPVPYQPESGSGKTSSRIPGPEEQMTRPGPAAVAKSGLSEERARRPMREEETPELNYPIETDQAKARQTVFPPVMLKPESPKQTGSGGVGTGREAVLEPESADRNVGVARKDLPGPAQALPAGVRDRLPPRKISVLSYSKTANGRFIRLNGEKIWEGGKQDNGLMVEAILQNGVIFRFDGHRFFHSMYQY